MSFEPGKSGNPAGRPKGTCGGRTLALRALDDILDEDATIEELKRALRDHLHRNPVRFFRDIVMPLLPKRAVLDLGEQGAVRWTSLLGTPSDP